MVAIASSFFLGGRFAALLLSTAFGKDNNFYAIANDVNNMGASLMEQQPGSSSFASSSLAAATADDTSSVISRRRLALCCFNQATLQCHPTTDCNGNQKDCESDKGKNKCNASGEYQWGDPNPPPPPAPTNPPTNQPTNVQTPPPVRQVHLMMMDDCNYD